MHRVYLIPGFFGFANFGDLKYFAHVRDRLERAFESAGAEVEIHYVRTLPTASLSRRAARLADAIAETDDGSGVLHLIGHSTGGIDARLLTSPGVTLPCDPDVEDIASRVDSVVAIASPHYGAPLAATFTSVLGQSLLRALSLLTLHSVRLGSVPLSALVAVAGALPSTGPMQGPVASILDQVYRQLLKDFDAERQSDIEAFFATAREDQGLLPQLSPDGMDLFNAATAQRSTARYGCVVARCRPPAWRSVMSLGLSPSAQATYALYRALWQLASTQPASVGPALTIDQRTALSTAFGDVPGSSDNDAIVPSLSQVFGEVVYAAWADHLDVIGHFAEPDTEPPHVDWLMTRSGFDRLQFEAQWSAIGAYLLGR